MRLTKSLVTALAVLTLYAPSALAGGSGHDAINFYVLCLEYSGNAYECPPSFVVREANVNTPIEIERGEHASGSTTFNLSATSGTATAGDDFVGGTQSITTTPKPGELDYEMDHVRVGVLDDGEEEPVEHANLALSGPTGGTVLAFPNQASLTIADNDGADRFSFEFGSQEIFENRKALRVNVIRAGANISNAVSVDVSTVAGSAVAPEDFTSKTQTLFFTSGQIQEDFTVAITNDEKAETEESFTLSLSNATGGATIENATTTIDIEDEDAGLTDDIISPYSAFHQPLHGETYSPEEAQGLLVFAQDNDGGTGVEKVQIAIRKNMSNGSCRWWTGNRFRAGDCSEKRWARTGSETKTDVDPPTTSNVWFFEIEERFKRSVRGSGIRNYTAYSRGRDVAGNLQRSFVKGQNRNTYEIK